MDAGIVHAGKGVRGAGGLIAELMLSRQKGGSAKTKWVTELGGHRHGGRGIDAAQFPGHESLDSECLSGLSRRDTLNNNSQDAHEDESADTHGVCVGMNAPVSYVHGASPRSPARAPSDAWSSTSSPRLESPRMMRLGRFLAQSAYLESGSSSGECEWAAPMEGLEDIRARCAYNEAVGDITSGDAAAPHRGWRGSVDLGYTEGGAPVVLRRKGRALLQSAIEVDHPGVVYCDREEGSLDELCMARAAYNRRIAPCAQL